MLLNPIRFTRADHLLLAVHPLWESMPFSRYVFQFLSQLHSLAGQAFTSTLCCSLVLVQMALFYYDDFLRRAALTL